jgi:hypothetical protein
MNRELEGETAKAKFRRKDKNNGSVRSALFDLWRVRAWTIMNLLSTSKEKSHGKDF